MLNLRIVSLMVKLPTRSWHTGRVQDNQKDKGGEVSPHENSLTGLDLRGCMVVQEVGGDCPHEESSAGPNLRGKKA